MAQGPHERFTFEALTPELPRRGGSALSLAGLNDHQLRQLAVRLHQELDQTQEELRVLVDQAREEGIREGLEQARGELAAALLAATDSIHAAIEHLGESIDHRFESVVRDSTGLVLVAGEYLAGRAMVAAPLDTISLAISGLLAQMHQLHDIEVEVHPSLVEPLRISFPDAPVGARKSCRLEIIGNADLVPGDAQISWGSGGLKIDLAARRTTLLDTLAVLLPDEPVPPVEA